MAFNQPYELQWETLAVPLVKGLNLQARARLVEPPGLLKALNVRFPRDGGPEKRFGHRGFIAKSTATYPADNTLGEALSDPAAPDPYNPNRVQPTNWLYGWGLFDPAVVSVVGGHPAYSQGGDGATGTVSPHPHAGVLFGALARDHQAAVWDGFRLYPVMDSNTAVRPVGAIAPWARTQAISKTGSSQKFVTGADNGSIRVVAWVEDGNIGYQTFDSETGAIIQEAVRGGTVSSVKALAVGKYLHLYYHQTGDNTLRVIVRATGSTAWSSSVSLGTTTELFDIRTVNANTALVVKAQTSTDIRIRYVNETGELGAEATLNVGAATVTELIGLAWSQSSQTICVVMGDGANLWYRIYGATGTALYALVTVVTATVPRATVSDTWLLESGTPKYHIFWEETSGGRPKLQSRAFGGATPLGASPLTRWNLSIAGQAIRVGERAFVLAANTSTLQSTWFLLGQDLKPVGRWNIGTAYWNDSWWLHPMGWTGTAPAKDRVVFHTALGAKTRVAGPGQSGVFTEPYPLWVDLDFLPPLRHAQAGRTTFVPGAQLWAYDGVGLNEAGFPLYPETVTLTSANGTGNLTANGVYTYRIDLCHKNAQGEEVRSASLLHYTNGASLPTALPAGHDEVALSGPTIPSGIGGYLLIWRNENNGTVWYLVNSRDPSSADYRANDQTVATWSFTDRVADSTLLAGREIHPSGVETYINPFPAPASEVIASGRERLWLAGGEIAPGTVSPSRLFAPGERPSFSPVVETEVDRGIEPVTGIGFVGDVTAVFRRNSILAIDSDGPDNNANGQWTTARSLVTDAGALTQESIVRSTAGLLFQAEGGFRMVNAAGSIALVGADVDPEAADMSVAGAVVQPEDQEIRFYGRAGEALVVAYEQGLWSKWTLRVSGAVRTSVGHVVLAGPRGTVLVEDQDETTDGGSPYELVVRLGWLGASGLGGFQRIRRVAGFGEFLGHHTARIRFYYDEREYPEEEFSWVTSNDLVNGAWGDGNWGSGIWGDPTGNGEDSVWRWRRRPRRQKCSVFSVEMSDGASPTRSFIPVVLAVEVGRRGGADRIPARTFGT